jgi:plastocyanin
MSTKRGLRGFLPLLLLLFGMTAVSAASAATPAEDPKTDPGTGKVTVRLSEYKVELPETLHAGPTTFVVHNVGEKTHSFKIEGPGIPPDTLLAKPIPPDATAELQVTLQPGEYKVFCPIGSHEGKGMVRKLTVTAKP